jgi:Ca2+-binding EF-hand superfamily protein
MQRKSIPISQIREIRKGQKTDRFKKFSKIYGSRNKTSFSIIYGSEYASLDVIAGDDDEVRVWCVGLQHLIDKNAGKAAASGGESSGGAAASSLSGLELRERRLRKVWDQGDKNGDGQLTLVEVEKLLPVLNCPMNKKKVRQLFDAANTSGTTLDFGEFVTFYTALTEREEVTALMNRYSGGKDTLTVDQLRKFLTETQREVGRNIDSLLTSYEPSDEARAAKMMTRDGFTALLFGPECSVFQEAHGRVYQDMDHPLTDYYMASSHNTYLLEDQLKGPSSVEAYIRALRDGCRCVELDCWDGPDDEPIVYHGLTLTSKILFKDIVAAIKEHAFASSPYPVVLSLENHCSVPQQAIMAQHLTSILGSMLAQGDPDETREKMPSPEELKGKVLCKAKRPKVDDDGAAAAAKAAEEAAAAAADDSDDSDSDDDDDNEEVPKISEEEKAQLALKKKKVKVAPELARLILYCQAVHFHSFEDSAKRGKYYQMSSFGEAKTRKLSAKNSNAFMLYNQKQFSRVYPAGSRVDSSNYDPTFAWNAGCQIVALNYQTPGRSMQLNRGRFRQNGACGYVLKPAVMRDPNSAYDVNAKKPAKGVLRKTITVRVISGQNLPKPGEKSKGEVIDPYVVVELVGVPADAAQHTTKTVDDNGFNPMWDETFVFNTIMPDVALLRFKVMDKDLDADDFIGQFCCPVDSLAQGFRTVHLERVDGLRLEQGWLFVEIKIDVEVPKI